MNGFWVSESGAVTVDWVVLTAGLVGLGLAVMTVVSSGVKDLATDIDREMSSTLIQTAFTPDYQSIVDNYTHLNCPGGTDAAIAFSEAHYALGDPDNNSYDYEVGDIQSVLDDYRNGSIETLQANLDGFRNDYVTRPEAFTLAHSNDMEYAIVECVAAERGLT